MKAKLKKEYTGTCYIGVTGSDNEVGVCRDSIANIALRPGDSSPAFARATKGSEARQLHINKFIDETKHDFCLMLDADMVFPPLALEGLRLHKLPFISGLYMRRDYQPVAPIWFRPWAGKWPYEPWLGEIERGKLRPIGASGWGCMLLHREVILAVRALLKGEQEIMEDDLDVWPYDIKVIYGAINGIKSLIRERPSPLNLWPMLGIYAKTLESEIRPLRADREMVGSDLRFPFFALQAGYQLYGDPEVRCSHVLNYPLSPDDYEGIPMENRLNMRTDLLTKRINPDRARLQRQKREIRNA